MEADVCTAGSTLPRYTRRAFIVASRQSGRSDAKVVGSNPGPTRGGDDASRRFAAERAGKAEAEAAVGVVEGNRVREVVVEGG